MLMLEGRSTDVTAVPPALLLPLPRPFQPSIQKEIPLPNIVRKAALRACAPAGMLCMIEDESQSESEICPDGSVRSNPVAPCSSA